ncbi:MAG: hypothetical protein WBG43_05580 [Marinifilaceae bacterium]
MKVDDINEVVEGFKEEGDYARHRFTSFDYCYNYFASNKGQALLDDMEKSCLVLGFYLASWGMLRGSSFLLDKSVMHYKDTIRYISKCDEKSQVKYTKAKIIDMYGFNKSFLAKKVD